MLRKYLVYGVLFLFIGITLFSSSGTIVSDISQIDNSRSFKTLDLRGHTLYVGGSGPDNYTKIQVAINNASDGDTIFVFNGTYYENIVVNKTLNLTGENKNITIIDGNTTRNVVNISANKVSISGFTIQHSGIESEIYAGISINSSNNTIYNNVIKNNNMGMFLWHFSHDNVISNNFVTNDLKVISSNNITFFRNNFQNSSCIWIEGSLHTTICNNTFESGGINFFPLWVQPMHQFWDTLIIKNNTRNGRPIGYYKNANNRFVTGDFGQLIIANCTIFIIYNCTIRDIKGCSGIQIGFSKQIVILKNTYSNCDVGMFFLNSTQNLIAQNNFIDNLLGISFRNTSDNTICRNNMSVGSSGIYLMSSSSYNSISENNITGGNNLGIEMWYGEHNKIFDNNISNFSWAGIRTCWSLNSTIMNNKIWNNEGGIRLWSSHNTQIQKNSIINNTDYGINLHNGSNNIVLKNIISQSGENGIYLDFNAHNNYILKNTIYDNNRGIFIDYAEDNAIYHNNFVNNTQHAYDEDDNTWYNETLHEGNYWDDYTGDDNDSDGIGDTPYDISGDSNQDLYPLMCPWGIPPADIYVDDDADPGWYDATHVRTIQEGVDNASAGDTVFVYNGIYNENIIIDTTLKLIGEDKNNTVIDGKGTGDVISIPFDHVYITNFTIKNGTNGINLNRSSNITITHNIITENTDVGIFSFSIDNTSIDDIQISDNTISNNDFGIYLECWPLAYNITIVGNTFLNNPAGVMSVLNNSNISKNEFTNNTINIDIYGSYNVIKNNILKNNNISRGGFSNRPSGIGIGHSTNNIITNNILESTGITLLGESLPHFTSHIIQNNTANGQLIRYYKNTNGFVIPSNTSQVILANCTNITIQNLTLSNTDIGIQLGYSSNNFITHNTIAENSDEGIKLYSSHNNNFSYNVITRNYRGARLDTSSHNIFFNNTIKNNTLIGIQDVSSSSHTTFIKNTIRDNRYGIDQTNSDNTSIRVNNIRDNRVGIYMGSSNNNTINNNNLTNNKYGISFSDSSAYNRIYENTIKNCNHNGIGLAHSNNNSFNDNTLVNNSIGIIVSHAVENIFLKNSLTNNDYGIQLDHSICNIFSENLITNNEYDGIRFYDAVDNNTFTDNTIANNQEYGLYVYGYSNNNLLYHNNFINNTINAYDDNYDPTLNFWDNGYPNGGNYWDDHWDPDDDFSGPDQNISGSDGIIDKPYYILMCVNLDRYPLFYPWSGTTGDLDGNGDVDYSDLDQLLSNYGTQSDATYWMGDLNSDGDVDLSDLAALLGNYGTGT